MDNRCPKIRAECTAVCVRQLKVQLTHQMQPMLSSSLMSLTLMHGLNILRLGIYRSFEAANSYKELRSCE
eukprot:scaffold8381_cov40-Prasinocladus_malaysianus.AAC.2